MKFAPKSENEIKSMLLMQPGQYKYTVASATNAISKSGNEMIKLVLSIWDEMGLEHHIYDYLLEQMPMKLRHFCESSGLIDRYELGALDAENCVGKSGMLEIEIQQGTQKADGGMYPDKNAVKDYLCVAKSNQFDESMFDDNIPF